MQTINKLYNAIKESQRGTSSYDTPATVTKVEGGYAWCSFPGSASDTPVKLTMAAAPGDTVQVRVSNGTATLTGNMTAPPTDDKAANAAHSQALEASQKAAEIEEKTSCIEANSNGVYIGSNGTMKIRLITQDSRTGAKSCTIGEGLTPPNPRDAVDQVVLGKYNKRSTDAFVFGYGSEDNPENLLALSTSGYLMTKGQAGFITLYAGQAWPRYWLECDGSEVSRTRYSNLYDAIGDTFGPGDGSTTFNLPDLTAQAPANMVYIIATGNTDGRN